MAQAKEDIVALEKELESVNRVEVNLSSCILSIFYSQLHGHIKEAEGLTEAYTWLRFSID